MKIPIISALLLMLTLPYCSKAQIHPLSFGPSTTFVNPNWYRSYVGMRLEVTAPASIAGDYNYTAANDGSGSVSAWGGYVTTPLVNVPIIMGSGAPGSDSFGCSSFTAGSMTGKIAVLWRGPISSSCEYGTKALNAQNAGAVACVIINEFPGMGPLGMGAGTVGSSVSIPVFMIGNLDGISISAKYHSLPAGTVKMTITPWQRNLNNDLGFVPQGIAGWSNYATPYKQMFPGINANALKGMDGAFVANFGAHNATHVKLTDTLRYTPTSAATTVVHTGVSPTVNSFPPVDSIYALFGVGEYSFAPTVTGTGKFDLKYTIVADSADQYSADNTATYSFYATDSVYSKGKYDLVNKMPVSGIWEAPAGGGEFLWGPMYYVARGGAAVSSVQFSIASGAGGSLSGSPDVTVYVLKWVDGSGGYPFDSVVQNGEMTEVAYGTYSFSPTDTSQGVFKCQMVHPLTGLSTPAIVLDSGSWYYVAVDVPSGGYYLGVDGNASPYPRIYGRKHVSNNIDYSSVLWVGSYEFSDAFTASPGSGEAPCPFTATYYVNTIDSFNYNNLKGMIPSVALITNNNPIGIIGGSIEICSGSSTTLSDAISGGTWSSGTTSVATVGSSSGIVHGVAPGTSVITYTTSSGTATVVFTVDATPVTGSISGPSVVCQGATITLTGSYSGGTWSEVTGNATVSPAGVVTGVTPGIDVISFTYANACGTIFENKLVTINPLPAAGSISGSSTVCVGATTPLTDLASGGVWSTVGGHASVSLTGVVTGVTIGTDSVKYTVTNSCGTAMAYWIITVNPALSPGTITGPPVVCVGATITLADAVSGGVWSTAIGNASVSSVGVVTGVTAGTDTVRYSVTTACGTAMTYSVITIHPLAAAGAITGSSTVCIGTTITLSDPVAGGTWSTVLGNASVSSTGVVSGITVGIDTVEYSVTNTCGTAIAKSPITIDPALSTGTISGPSAVCVGSTVTLSDAVSGGTWSTAIGNASVSGGVVTGVTAGTDTVKYTVTSTCGSGTTTSVVTVNPLPVPVIVAAGITLSTTVPYASYQWLFSGSAIGGATDATYDAPLDGAYAVTVTDDNGCSATSDVSLVSTTSVQNVNTNGDGISVYPNPTSGMFTIQTKTTGGTFAVYTIDGREVVNYKVNAGTNTLHLPKDIASGVYMCKYNGDSGGTVMVRLVYER